MRRIGVLTSVLFLMIVVVFVLGGKASGDEVITDTKPALTQSSKSVWTTKVVIQGTQRCVTKSQFLLSISSSDKLLVATNVTPNSQKCPTAETATVTFDLLKAATPSSALLLFTSTGGTPSTVSLTTIRSERGFVKYLLPIGGGALLAVLFLLGVYKTNRPSRIILASSSWSFTDSWATNITAVGSLLTTVLTASGSLTSYLPAVSLDWFTLLSIAWGGLVVLAPLINGALAEDKNNSNAIETTLGAVSVAAVVTLFGVGGEMGTIASLICLSPRPESPTAGLLYAGLAAAAAVVLVYGVRSIVAQLNPEGGTTTVRSSGLSRGSLTSLTL